MPDYRHHLPRLDAEIFLTDGGIETTLMFDDGIELPDFAAFPLLADPAGRAALNRYFDSYTAIAVRDGDGIVLETPTWRASAGWGARLGKDGGYGGRQPRRRRLASRAAPAPRNGLHAGGHLRVHRSAWRRLPGQ